MVVKILLFFALLVSVAFAEDDMIQRKWWVPEMAPIIEVFDESDDPFEQEPLVLIHSYQDGQIKEWLKDSGVNFPPNSSLRTELDQRKRRFLIVKNTSENLEIIDHVLSAKYPVHTTQQLIEKFLSETKGKNVPEVIPVVGKYTEQVLGPLASLSGELYELDRQLTFDLEAELRKKVEKRRAKILKVLPASLDATREYLAAMNDLLKE